MCVCQCDCTSNLNFMKATCSGHDVQDICFHVSATTIGLSKDLTFMEITISGTHAGDKCVSCVCANAIGLPKQPQLHESNLLRKQSSATVIGLSKDLTFMEMTYSGDHAGPNPNGTRSRNDPTRCVFSACYMGNTPPRPNATTLTVGRTRQLHAKNAIGPERAAFQTHFLKARRQIFPHATTCAP